MNTPFIDIHTHKKGKPVKGCVSVINFFAGEGDEPVPLEDTFFSIGLHPWHISNNRLKQDFELLRKSVINKYNIAIGETGLDRFAKATMGAQKEVFEFHLKVAQNLKKPVIIHAVRTYPDIIEAYKKSGADVKLIFHGFNGNLQIARQLTDRNFYLSFGEDLFDNRKKTAAIFEATPLNNIFLETDESAKSIVEIYEKAASIKKVNLGELKEYIFKNFNSCFGSKI